MSPQARKSGLCQWCENDASHVVILVPGALRTVRGQKVWKAEQSAKACEVHAHGFVLKSKEVRPI